MKIISGGQIGADIAGLRAAKKLGYETGGWMPKDFKTLDGSHPEYAEMYGIKECSDGGYPARTRLNVMASDCTLRFAVNFKTPGERLTARLLNQMKKPYLDVELFHDDFVREKWWTPASKEQIIYFLGGVIPNTINIAGNALEEIEDPVEKFLIRVFS